MRRVSGTARSKLAQRVNMVGIAYGRSPFSTAFGAGRRPDRDLTCGDALSAGNDTTACAGAMQLLWVCCCTAGIASDVIEELCSTHQLTLASAESDRQRQYTRHSWLQAACRYSLHSLHFIRFAPTQQSSKHASGFLRRKVPPSLPLGCPKQDVGKWWWCGRVCAVCAVCVSA